ncbi:MAG: glutamine-hydrolyzing carbamoyl-phosphate synthase small subunit [Opitutales bacterium]|nr:glutamine-hydrolyzing carbamoyl-phosphate synthase small subunit [Opitutales bacterium]
MDFKRNGVLVLEDGTIYRGYSFGGLKTVVGEAVFNTSMTGYQEILTDPSYYQQIVVMTASQIGNYGVNSEDVESASPKVQGFVVKESSGLYSSWRSEKGLPTYLKENGIPGLHGIDTRALTKRLRSAGAMKCCLSTEGIQPLDALKLAQRWEGLEGIDYVKEVTPGLSYQWDADGKDSRPFALEGTKLSKITQKRTPFRVAAYDFGAKLSIFRKLRQHGFHVHVFPAEAPPEAIREIKPDALFLSNGPGDPAAISYAHKSVRNLIQDYPTFGICLGHQIITHALGAKTFKLKFGHRGGNQPVKNIENGQVSITSQNHGFASTQDELEKYGAIVTEINMNDDTVEGLRHKDLPLFSVQYHPEASPGPSDAEHLFEQFYNLVSEVQG